MGENAASYQSRHLICYCSAAGARRKSMWARVRQRVESELLRLPFRHAGRGAPRYYSSGTRGTGRTPGYRIVLRLLTPLFLLSPRLVGGGAILVTIGHTGTRHAQCCAESHVIYSRDRGYQQAGPVIFCRNRYLRNNRKVRINAKTLSR